MINDKHITLQDIVFATVRLQEACILHTYIKDVALQYSNIVSSLICL